MDKTAIDNAAKKYWGTYFREYGQMWVRDIPRRIKNAMRRTSKTANLDGTLAPMAANIGPDGSLSVEAAFVGKIDDQDAKILITALFDREGHMKEIETTRIS
jgi:hypothetical protein